MNAFSRSMHRKDKRGNSTVGVVALVVILLVVVLVFAAITFDLAPFGAVAIDDGPDSVIIDDEPDTTIIEDDGPDTVIQPTVREERIVERDANGT